MGILLSGPEGFELVRRGGGVSRPLERLAKVSRAGELMAVLDRYEIDFADGTEETVYLERLCRVLGLPQDDDVGFYYSNGLDTEAEELFARLFAEERSKHVGLLRKVFEGRTPIRVKAFAHVQYQISLDNEDGEAMLAYLNGKLPEGAELTLEEVAGFDSEAMLHFDPEEDEPQRADGTGFVMYFLENDEEDEGLPLLSLLILTHAVVHEIEDMFVYEEPIYKAVLWKADGVEDEEAEEEDDDAEEDEDEEDE